MRIGNTRSTARFSGSPSPCRSPSPDLMNKNTIIQTKQSTPVKQMKNKVNQQFVKQQPHIMLEELKFYKTQNQKLRQTIAIRTNSGKQDILLTQIKQKDKIINELKTQLSKAESKPNRYLDAMNTSQASNDKDKTIKQLNLRIYELEHENDKLVMRRSNSFIDTPKQKPVKMDDPLPFINSSQNNYFLETQMQKIQNQLKSQLRQLSMEFQRKINYRLEQLQRRLSLIDHKLEGNTMSPDKRITSTIGSYNFDTSPGVGSNYNQSTLRNNLYLSDNRDPLNLNIHHQLENQQQQFKIVQTNLRKRINQLENELQNKRIQINILSQQIGSKNRDQLSYDLQSKHLLQQQNINLKQNLSRISAEVVQLKNNESYIKNQYQQLRRQYQNEFKIKIQNNSYQNMQNNRLQDNNDLFNRQLQSNVRSLNDKISILNRSIQQYKSIIQQHEKSIEYLRSQNSNIKRQLGQLRDRKLTQQTQISRLKYRVDDLQRTIKGNETINNQLTFSRHLVQRNQQQTKQLKSKLLNQQQSIVNLKNQLQRVYFQNDNLKKTNYENSKLNNMVNQSSNHTKQQLARVNQQRNKLQIQNNQYKIQVRALENNLSVANQRGHSLEVQRLRTQNQNKIIKDQISQLHQSLSFERNQKSRLQNQNYVLKSKISDLQNNLSQSRNNNNDTQNLFIQINSLNYKLKLSEQQALSYKNLQLQRNSELQNALSELSEVKRILRQMNFQSIEVMIRELKSKQHISEQQRYKIESMKRQVLEYSEKYIEQKEKTDRMTSYINHLEVNTKQLQEKIQRLESIIKQYMSSQTSPIKITTTQSSVHGFESFSDNLYDNDFGKDTIELDQLKEPVHQAVSRLDKITQKLQNKIGRKSQSLNNVFLSTFTDVPK